MSQSTPALPTVKPAAIIVGSITPAGIQKCLVCRPDDGELYIPIYFGGRYADEPCECCNGPMAPPPISGGSPVAEAFTLAYSPIEGPRVSFAVRPILAFLALKTWCGITSAKFDQVEHIISKIENSDRYWELADCERDLLEDAYSQVREWHKATGWGYREIEMAKVAQGIECKPVVVEIVPIRKPSKPLPRKPESIILEAVREFGKERERYEAGEIRWADCEATTRPIFDKLTTGERSALTRFLNQVDADGKRFSRPMVRLAMFVRLCYFGSHVSFPEPSDDATDPDIILDPDATVLDIPVSDDDQVIPHGWDAIEADDPKPIPRGWDAIEADDEKAPSVPQGRSSADDDDSYRKAREIIEARRYGAEMHAVEGVIWNVVSSIMANVQADPHERGKLAWGKLADRSFDAMTGPEREDFEAWLAFIGYRPGAWYSPTSTSDRWEAFILECLTGVEITTSPSPEPNGDDRGCDGQTPEGEDMPGLRALGADVLLVARGEAGRHGSSMRLEPLPILAHHDHPRFLVSRFPGGFSLVPNPLAGLTHDDATSDARADGLRADDHASGVRPSESRHAGAAPGVLADPGIAGHPLPVARDGAGTAEAPGLDGQDGQAEAIGTLTILVHGLGQPCHSADTACTGADHDIDAGIRSEGLGIRSEGRPGGQHGVGPANGALEANPRVDPDGRAQPISRSDHRSSQTVALTIGGRPYNVTSGPGWLDLEKSSGESYRVTLEGSQGPSCDCHDYRYRRAGLDSLGCKHLRALRAEGLLPRPTPAYDLIEF
jgi:hypothetical protein